MHCMPCHIYIEREGGWGNLYIHHVLYHHHYTQIIDTNHHYHGSPSPTLSRSNTLVLGLCLIIDLGYV